MDDDLRSRFRLPDSSDPARPTLPTRPRSHQPAPLPEPRPAPAQHQATAKGHARPKRRFRLVKILAILLVLGLAGAGGGYYLKYVKPPTPLPQSLVKAAGFAVYYPTKLPGAYKYQPASAANQKGLFTYKIADGSDGVVITEQPKPANFDPSKLPNFKPVNVSDGTAVIGISSGVMTVVYTTPTTLINITAVNAISRGDMISIIQSLNAIKQPAKLL